MEKCKNHPKFSIKFGCELCEEIQRLRDEEKMLLKAIDDLRYLDEIIELKSKNAKLLERLGAMRHRAQSHF